MNTQKALSNDQQDELMNILADRFQKNIYRHSQIDWSEVVEKLKSNPGKLLSLQAMEDTGGEPDIIGYDKKSGRFIFCDCSSESPKGRRSICYDAEALESRKQHKPNHSAVAMAMEMGVELLTEEQYRELQKIGTFDAKTSSWLQTPTEIRKKGGAIFGDWRYGQVFIYHNGAESYYAARGFRGILYL